MHQDLTVFWQREKKMRRRKIPLFIGAIAAVAGIAFAVYKFFTPDYLEDFEEDFDDDFDYDFDDETEE